KISEKKLKEWDEEKRTELTQMNWSDIWSYDGEFQQTKENDLIRMRNISFTIKKLLFHQSSINVDFNNVSQEFEKISERQKSMQQEIEEKCFEKEKLKGEVDKAILNYTQCIDQYNDLCATEMKILIQKQQTEQQRIVINQIHDFNNKVLKGFNKFNDTLQKLIKDNQNWVEKKWNELEKKWSTWNSREIAIFIGRTLECKKSKINQYNAIIEEKKINGSSLLKMSKKDLMDIFETFSHACLIHDSLVQLCKKYPVDVIIFDNDVSQEGIPKKYLCPLPHSIMNDPVIALNQIIYDRSSIMNRYQEISNGLSKHDFLCVIVRIFQVLSCSFFFKPIYKFVKPSLLHNTTKIEICNFFGTIASR
ncbi:hypothetical protein RFI_25647, partial [Reticulomyxa filosa]